MRAAFAGLGAAALVLASATFAIGRGGWPGSQLTDVVGLVGLICTAPFAVAFVAGRRRGATREAAPEAAPSFALMALKNQRLETQLHSTLTELRASRLRILSAADQERRRIERDLHDGAQQRLVALGIQLELAAELVEADPGRAAARLRGLAGDVDEAVDEVRALARGLVPPMLVERGLADALRDIVLSSPLIARVQAAELGRYAREIESAVYFCCLEALQNAAKHAAGARFVTVRLWEEDELHFEVRDDGAGIPDGPRRQGAGLTNMRDRIGAVGGSLTIESRRGEGTCVAGSAPLELLDAPDRAEGLLRQATDALEDRFAIYRAVRGERGVVVDFLVEHMNDAACAERGMERAELVGRRLGELDPRFLASADFRWLHRALGAGRPLRRGSGLRAAALGGGRVMVTSGDASVPRRALVRGAP